MSHSASYRLPHIHAHIASCLGRVRLWSSSHTARGGPFARAIALSIRRGSSAVPMLLLRGGGSRGRRFRKSRGGARVIMRAGCASREHRKRKKLACPALRSALFCVECARARRVLRSLPLRERGRNVSVRAARGEVGRLRIAACRKACAGLSDDTAVQVNVGRAHRGREGAGDQQWTDPDVGVSTSM